MIRLATNEDIPRIVQMGSRSLVIGPYRDMIQDDPETAAKLAAEIIMQRGRILLLEHEGEVVGLLGFIVSQHYFSKQIEACELMWWVEPEHRGSFDALGLMAEAEKQAAAMGANSMILAAPNEQVGRAYQRFGYAPIETNYRKVLTCHS